MIIEEPLLRRQDESAIVRMVVKVHPDGKASKTTIRPLQYFEDKDMTLVECKTIYWKTASDSCTFVPRETSNSW